MHVINSIQDLTQAIYWNDIAIILQIQGLNCHNYIFKDQIAKGHQI